jgi:hypothetical protein
MFRFLGRMIGFLFFFGVLLLLIKLLPLLFLATAVSASTSEPTASDIYRRCTPGAYGFWTDSDEQGEHGSFYKCETLFENIAPLTDAEKDQLKELFASGSTVQLPDALKAKAAKQAWEKAEARSKVLDAPFPTGVPFRK